MDQGNLHLNYKQPVVASDGHTIFISDQGPATLVFFQMRDQAPGGMEADVVAAVRLHNLDELEALQKTIADTVKKHKTREP